MTKPNLEDVPDEVPALPKVFCDVCGKQATQVARDLQRVPGTETDSPDYMRYKRKGKVKAGCDEHPVKSVTHP